jgi:hypothetical protein
MHGIGAIIGVIVGFLAAMWPNVMDLIRDRFVHQHELEVNQQSLDAAKAGLELASAQHRTIEDLQAQNEQLALAATQDVDGDSCTLTFLRSSVRPTLTYGFFLLFVIIKLIGIHHAFVVEHASALMILPLVWDEDTSSLFAAVMSFWFGSRAVTKAYAQHKKADAQVVNTLTGRNSDGPVVNVE